MTQDQVEELFQTFDAALFQGRLSTGTQVELLVPTQGNRLAQPEDGACRSDGSVVYLNPRSEHDWQCTLLHEMVHAFEYRFGSEIAVSTEGRAAEQRFPPHPFYGGHSAKFFTKLFEVIRHRGDDPEHDFDRYFR
jgi:hypothetical protein